MKRFERKKCEFPTNLENTMERTCGQCGSFKENGNYKETAANNHKESTEN